MRTIRIAVAVMALVAVPALASAQNEATAQMNVTANIIKALTLTKVSAGDLDFGTVAAGTSPSIAPASANAIKFQANGQANTAISVTFNTATLTRGGGTETVTFTPSVTSFDADVQASGTAVATSNTRTLHATTGDRFFWVGGNLGAIPAGQVGGTYTGTWTLSIAY